MMTTPHVTLLLPYFIVNKNSDLRLCFSKQTFRSVLNEAWNSVDWCEINCLFSIPLLVLLKKLIKRIEKKSLIRIFFIQQNKNYLSLKNSFIIDKKFSKISLSKVELFSNQE
jgi:hypothetical protein